MLEGKEDPRLREVADPDDSSVVYRWYRLKRAGVGKPTWPEDADLDRVIQFMSTDHNVERVLHLKLRRVTTPDQRKIYLRRMGYDIVRRGRLNDRYIPLVGFWGRAKGFNVSDDLETIFGCASRSFLQPLLREGVAGPAVLFDIVIEIKESGNEREREISCRL